MEFVDTHCHLDDDAFATDLPQVIETARAVGVERSVNIGYEPASWIASIDLAAQFPHISYSLGMHPNSVDGWNSDSADELERLLASTSPVAIGEIGLDYFRDHADPALQHSAFRDQLVMARKFSLPVIVHMRGDVEDEIISVLDEFPDVRVIFHSFDASDDMRYFALARQGMIGVGGLMTRAGSAKLRETLRRVPLESILLETDAPYLVPRGVKDRRNTPANIPIIASALSELLGLSAERVAEQTTANAKAVFSLDRVGV